MRPLFFLTVGLFLSVFFFVPCFGWGQTGPMDWDTIPSLPLPTTESVATTPPNYMDSVQPVQPVQLVPSVSVPPVSTGPPASHSIMVSSPPSSPPPSSISPPSTRELRSAEDTNHPLYGLLRPPVEDTEIRGEPAPLATVINGVSAPEERGKLIRLYWEMTGLLIEYHCHAQQEQSLAAWLKGAQPSAGISAQGQTAILQAGHQVATARRRMTELEFLQKQCQLAAAMRRHSLGGMGSSSVGGVTPNSYGTAGTAIATFTDDTATSPSLSLSMPLPCDYPLVLPYDPKSSAISKVSGRPLSLKAMTLSKTIPLQYRLMTASAEAFRAADSLFATIRDGGNLTPESLLLAFDQQVTAKVTYVRSIIEYNQQIADYVAETVGPEIHGRSLLSTMLVLTPIPTAAAESGQVVMTGGTFSDTATNSNQVPPTRSAQPFGYTEMDVADTVPMIPPPSSNFNIPAAGALPRNTGTGNVSEIPVMIE